MTPLHRRSHESRIALCDPAEKEAGAAHAVFGGKIKQAQEIVLHARGEMLPGVGRRRGGQVEDVEPVLDIDGEYAVAIDRLHDIHLSARPGKSRWTDHVTK